MMTPILSSNGVSGKPGEVQNENMDVVRAEVSRVTLLLEDLAKEIEDPSTDLSAGMRASRQQTELEAYLKGLRFALGEVEV